MKLIIMKLMKPTSLYAKTLIIWFLALFLAACSSDDGSDPKPATFTVTFNANQGTPVPGVQRIEENKFATRPPNDPTRAGFTFDGWHSDEGLTQRFEFTTTPITGNIILYAKWTAINENELMVTFNTNGGSSILPSTVEKGQTVDRPDDPTREGYTFEGWFTDNGIFQEAFDFKTPIETSIILYAQWTAINENELMVTFNTNGGSSILPSTVEKGQTVDRPDDPTREGYAFEGWFTDNGIFQEAFDFKTSIETSIILYAQWQKINENELMVTFNTNGGSSIPPSTVEKGQTVDRPDDPTREGYTFEGWFTDNGIFQKAFDFKTSIDTSIILYAQWQKINENELMVTFNTNGGSSIPPSTVEKGQTVDRPDDPTREGYTFEGWFTDNGIFQGAFDFKTSIETSIILYAKWGADAKVSYTVTFETNGGSAISSQNVNEGDFASDPGTPTRQDYTFEGWFEEETFNTPFDFATKPITADTKVYAKWKENGFEIPDEKFRAYIKTRIPDAFINGGELLDVNHPDVKSLTDIVAPKMGIESLEGIQFFTSISSLDVSGNTLKELTLSSHVALTTLNVSENELKTLDVNGAVNLTTINCSMNELTVLSFMNNAKLTTLDCSANRLITLDARNNKMLTSWTIYVPSAPNRPTRANPGLAEIHLHRSRLCDNGIKTIYFANRGTSNMKFIAYSDDGTVKTYDNTTYELTCISNIPDPKFRAYLKKQLPDEAFNGEFLNTLNSKVLDRREIDISGIEVVSLEGIQYFTGLTKLTAINSKIEGKLELSNNTALTNVALENNEITDLDLSKSPKLESLNCRNNKLTDLDLSKNTALISLFCEGNLLRKLNISTNANIDPGFLAIHKDNNTTNPNLQEILVHTALLCSDGNALFFNRGVKSIFNANKSRLQMKIEEYDANGKLIKTYDNDSYATKCD